MSTHPGKARSKGKGAIPERTLGPPVAARADKGETDIRAADSWMKFSGGKEIGGG